MFKKGPNYMNTIDSVKQDLIDYVANLDKTKMSIFELKTYADLVNSIDMMYKPSYADALASAMTANKFNWNGVSVPKDLKLGKYNGE